MTKTEGGVAATNGIRASSAKPSTSRVDLDATKGLNPKAPEYQPSPRIA